MEIRFQPLAQHVEVGNFNFQCSGFLNTRTTAHTPKAPVPRLVLLDEPWPCFQLCPVYMINKSA
jgi:hypothetical protein